MITVTQEDIKNGVKRKCGECPIALAARRAYPNSDIKVREWSLYIDNKVFTLPREAEKFVSDFDDEFGSVSPISFEIDEDKYVWVDDDGQTINKELSTIEGMYTWSGRS